MLIVPTQSHGIPSPYSKYPSFLFEKKSNVKTQEKCESPGLRLVMILQCYVSVFQLRHDMCASELEGTFHSRMHHHNTCKIWHVNVASHISISGKFNMVR